VQHDTIDWREEIPRGSGEYVRVGLFEKNEKVYIITVYKRVPWRGCCYQINELLDGGRISFGKSKIMPCRRGLRPTLAVRKDGTVIVVDEDKLTFTLRCHVGKINDSVSEITWKESPDIFPNSTTPSVAINDKNNIILFYRTRATGSLKYACGRLTDSITWKVKNQDYDTGIRPNVTLNNNQIVIITYMSFMGRELYLGNGTMNDEGLFTVAGKSRTLRWQGMHPAVCLSDENQVVLIYKSTRTGLRVTKGIQTVYSFA
jgi:hypothetical protein